MTLKNASFLAFIGTGLVTLLLLWYLISNIINVAQGLVAANVLLASLLYAFGSLTVTIFFYGFQKNHR
ncbi:MAG TPA: hypothetical protein VGL53_05290 [Bryobacteraceae bacterium]|jgi:uncharacterized membrane protein